MQVRDLPPGAADPLVRVFQRRDEAFPGGRRVQHRGDGGATGAEQLVDGGRDMLRPELREARQAREIEQRIERFGGYVHARFTLFAAARAQFSRSIAMVIGPTPPGTGVIQPATGLTAVKSTSPASDPSARRLMPTSTTQA